MGDGSVRDGVLEGIQQGYFHREIQDASYEYQERVEDGEEVVVGVNKYTMDEDTRPDLLHVSEEVQERQLTRLEEVKADRDEAAVEEALDAVREATENEENVMPALVDAVKADATMGEIMQVFETQYGQYRETVGLV